ncbi:MAG: hypothetical protein ACYC9X_13660 [Dehalococcoidia bacterium]
MLRITTWRLTGNAPADMTPQTAFQTINEMCGALSALPGAGRVRWFFGNGGIVIVGEPESYAVADTILKTPAAQVAVARVFALGYALVEDQFLLEPGQVMAFTQVAQTAQPAVSRN